MHAKELFRSAKQEHIKSSDRSAAKKFMIVIKLKNAHVEFHLH